MCGIAGAITREPLSEAGLQSMGDAIAHRGPDDSGVWREGEVALDHRRLSIIDLEGGKQPMVSADGSVVVVYNGEIYNFLELRADLESRGRRFRTDSDTEVLLHLYSELGTDMLAKLYGMFAFAIWDRRTRVLFLARDHLGQKPLFYYRSGGCFLFGSEIKALLASGMVDAQLDLNCLWHYTSLRFCPGDITLFQGIKKLPPGHFMQYRPSNQSCTVQRYWHLDFTRKTNLSFDEASAALDELLGDVVRQHLISDVPLGSFLSGGVDSSLVAAIASRGLDSDPPTFSIGVEDADFSELPFAREAAETVGSRHHEFVVESDLFRMLPEVVWFLEEPADPHSLGIYHICRLASQHVKVVLSGEGGDEIFGGYTRFSQSPLIRMYAALPKALRQHLLVHVLRFIPESFSYYSLAAKARWVHEMSFLSGAGRQYHAMTFFRFPERARERLFTPAAKQAVEDTATARYIAEHYDSDWVNGRVERALYTEQMTHLPEHFLLVGDRMSMAHSLESRLPLVDVRVAEFAAGLPASYKVHGSRLKVLLKDVAARYYTKEFLNRPKQGFGFPLARWFRGPLSGFVQSFLDEARLFDTGFFERATIDEIVEQHGRGAIDHNFRIWNFLNMEIWFRLFCLGESRRSVTQWIDGMLVKSQSRVPAPR
jgi:asparagine synthase (glutamine-hydrolysing)